MILGADPERTPVRTALWGTVPSAQDAFTLRSVLAAHQAAVQHTARLRRQQARDVQAAADIGLVGGQLGNAARVELTRVEIEAAEAREAEVREELAEAHARATRPRSKPMGLTHAYSPGAVRAAPPTDPKDAARAELDAARQSERQQRDRLVKLGNGPAELRAGHAGHLRKQAGALGMLAAVAVVAAPFASAGLPISAPITVIVVTAVSLLVAVLLLGLYGVTESRRRIARVRAAVPGASEDHDVALRRLVAAEAAAVAAGLDIIPSTLDADVEAAAGAPVPLAWDA